MVKADDAWWEKRLKENDKYKWFWQKGVDPEISDLWDAIYGSIVATGAHYVAATMDPRSLDNIGVENVSLEAEDDEGMAEDLGMTEELDDFDTPLELDAGEDDLQSAHTSITGREASTQATGKKATIIHPSPIISKRNKKTTTWIKTVQPTPCTDEGNKCQIVIHV